MQIHVIPDRHICILRPLCFEIKNTQPSQRQLLSPSRCPCKCKTGACFDDPTGEITPGLSSNLRFVLKLSLASRETSREGSYKTINCCFRFLDEGCMWAEIICSIQKRTPERSISDSSRPFSSLCFLYRGVQDPDTHFCLWSWERGGSRLPPGSRGLARLTHSCALGTVLLSWTKLQACPAVPAQPPPATRAAPCPSPAPKTPCLRFW